ncbi:MAG: NUDIX domain-containing protein [Chloroflexi bacterium]|nr:NUDIX domain-containing protein [Chloroflexota bacterium]MCI0842089.1 NUDIX domain-containing protein [Chloroflexota bacterium]
MSSLRQRATAILVRDEKVLLVRDRNRPGGGIGADELAISAVARELYEETALVPSAITYLLEHSGKHNDHHVIRIFLKTLQGEINVSGDADVEEFFWWDRVQNISVYPHVVEILCRSEGAS